MKNARLPLLFLVAISAAPVVGGWLLYLNPGWLPQARANHGDLLQPAHPVADLELATADGAPLALKAPGSDWLVLMSFARCGDACRSQLWNVRQVRLALGTGRDRVDRLLLLGEPPPAALATRLSSEFPQMRVALLDAASREALRGRLGPPADGLWLVDPMGDAMMRYDADIEPDYLLADLERLLKLSKHWRSDASR